MAGLSQQGLVRRLDGNEPVWEIAHDFIARMLGQLMGRMRPTIWHRIQPVLAPMILLSWIVLAAISIPYWQNFEERTAEENLRELGAVFSKAANGGLKITFQEFSDEVLVEAYPFLNRLKSIREIELNNELSPKVKFEFTSLEPLQGLSGLQRLDLIGATGITSLEPLKGLSGLQRLDLFGATGITSTSAQ